MRQMSDTLSGAKALRFSTNESLDPIGPKPDGRVLRFSRTVTVRRPDAMYFELHGRDQETPLKLAAYYDGRTLSLRNDVDLTWARVSVPATLDEMLDHVARQYALPVPIADVVYSVPYEAFLGRDTKGGFAGRENLDGVSCIRLAYTDAAVDVQLWVPASGQPLPRRVELTYKRAPGAPKAHIDFLSWDLAPVGRRRDVRVLPGARHHRDGVPGPCDRTPLWRSASPAPPHRRQQDPRRRRGEKVRQEPGERRWD